MHLWTWPGATCRLTIDGQSYDGAAQETQPGPHGLVQRYLWVGLPACAQAWLEVSCAGYRSITRWQEMRQEPQGGVQLEAILDREWPAPDAWTVDGRAFRASDGRAVRVRGCAMFLAFRQWLDGVDLSAHLALARALGGNTLRIFLRLAWAPLRETDYSDEQLLAFARWLRGQGFRAELVVLADCGDAYDGWEMPLEAQQAHVDRVARVLVDCDWLLFQLANEPSMNGVRPELLTLPAGAPWSRGSSHGEPSYALEPVGDYGNDHPPRSETWPERAIRLKEYSHAFNVPYVGDEPVGCSDGSIEGTSASADDQADYAAVAALLASGSTIHATTLAERGGVPTGRELECMRAAAAMWPLIPEDALLGEYTAGHLSTCPLVFQMPDDPTCLRVFGSILGDSAICVRVRGQAGAAVARDGWRIAREVGHIVYLER